MAIELLAPDLPPDLRLLLQHKNQAPTHAQMPFSCNQNHEGCIIATTLSTPRVGLVECRVDDPSISFFHPRHFLDSLNQLLKDLQKTGQPNCTIGPIHIFNMGTNYNKVLQIIKCLDKAIRIYRNSYQDPTVQIIYLKVEPKLCRTYKQVLAKFFTVQVPSQ